MKHVGFPNGIKNDKENLRKSIKNEIEDKNDERETRRFIVLEKDSKIRIGVLDYNSLDMKNKSCSFDIEIGEIECQGKGYGEDALRTFFKYLFEHYNLHRIELDTLLENVRAQNLYKKLGFKEIGIRRDVWIDQTGKYRNSIMMDMLKGELR